MDPSNGVPRMRPAQPSGGTKAVSAHGAGYPVAPQLTRERLVPAQAGAEREPEPAPLRRLSAVSPKRGVGSEPWRGLRQRLRGRKRGNVTSSETSSKTTSTGMPMWMASFGQSTTFEWKNGPSSSSTTTTL